MPVLCRNPLALGVRNERQTDRKRKEIGKAVGEEKREDGQAAVGRKKKQEGNK